MFFFSSSIFFNLERFAYKSDKVIARSVDSKIFTPVSSISKKKKEKKRKKLSRFSFLLFHHQCYWTRFLFFFLVYFSYHLQMKIEFFSRPAEGCLVFEIEYNSPIIMTPIGWKSPRGFLWRQFLLNGKKKNCLVLNGFRYLIIRITSVKKKKKCRMRYLWVVKMSLTTSISNRWKYADYTGKWTIKKHETVEYSVMWFTKKKKKKKKT